MQNGLLQTLLRKRSLAKDTGGQAAVLMLIAFMPATWCWYHTKPAAEALQPYEVTVEDPRLAAWQPLWIDARSREDYDAGHIGGAVPLNEQEWDCMLAGVFEVWKPDRPIIVYCSAGCDESERVAFRLRDLGMEPVYFLSGGYEAWKESH
jgi:rhodanese-related sulfurtransferase